jgi:acetyl-CoA carboxylase biotin carboxyl carrier protein
MDKEFIFELIDRIKDTKIEHIEIETTEGKVKVKQYIAPKVVYQTAEEKKVVEPVSVDIVKEEPQEKVEVEKKDESKKYHVIKSPLVGTFYRAPSPGAPPFVEEGDIVSKGQVLCIIEALKVMNEIESDVDGKVVKILVENGEPVEYGQELFYIEPL